MELVSLERGRQRGRRSLSQRLERFRDKRWQVGAVRDRRPVSRGSSPTTCSATRCRSSRRSRRWSASARRTPNGCGASPRSPRASRSGCSSATCWSSWLGSGPWQIALIVGLRHDVGGAARRRHPVRQPGGRAGAVRRRARARRRATRCCAGPTPSSGGAVALVAATVVPSAPLRRPREQAAVVLAKVGELLRAAAEVMVDGDVERGLDLLDDARATDHLVRRLQAAADEGMAVVASSPFRIRHRPGSAGWPTSSARSTGRCADPGAGAPGRGRRLPPPPGPARVRRPRRRARHRRRRGWSPSSATDQAPDDLRHRLLEIGAATGRVERADEMTAEVVLAQLRSVIVDLLMLTGLGQLEATDALPPPPR